VVAVLIDDMRAVMEAFHSENWAPDLLRYVISNLQANAPPGKSLQASQAAPACQGIYTLGRRPWMRADAAAALQTQHLQHGVVSVARALSNAYDELTGIVTLLIGARGRDKP
jgi:hypothetical protein